MISPARKKTPFNHSIGCNPNLCYACVIRELSARPAVCSGLIKYHAAMTSHISLKAEVTEELSGNRLDQIAAKLFPE
jgi:hypothetical protein